jgi:hydroxypyruvate reductase
VRLSSCHETPGATGPRALLLECFQAALQEVDGRRCVARQLDLEALTGRWHVVAIGKAAGAMTAGAIDRLGENLVRALVVTKPGHANFDILAESRVRIIESAHPQPDARSLEAGAAVVDFVHATHRDARVLWLISGGASSLVEALASGITLPELQRINAWLLGSGLGIAAMNTVRRRLSRLKGGGLAALAGSRGGLALMISDVPGDDPAVIGSGLLHTADADMGAAPALPAASAGAVPAEVEEILGRCPVRSVAPAGAVLPHRIVASNGQARAAARRRGRARGHAVRSGRGYFAGDAERVGRRFARRLAASEAGSLWVWGGESTVRLPAHSGRGGRNQHLALAAALAMQGVSGLTLLAAGTDGIDGDSDDAGAIVDDTTCLRGAEFGLEARTHLQGADSGSYLEQCGELLHTGPTYTNVGDLVLGFRDTVPP